MIGTNGEHIEHLVEKVPMLCRDGYAGGELRGLLAETCDDRRQLNRLGPRAENEEYAKQVSALTCDGK